MADDGADALAALGPAVREQVATARREWPALKVDLAGFAASLADKLTGDPAALQVSDLYLAYGCQEGDAEALAAFEAKVVPKVARGRGGRVSDDALQQLRERLFMRGKIAAYSGRGPLHRWARMVAVRLEAEGSGKTRRETELSEEAVSALIEADPEIKIAGREARAILKDALGASFAELELKQRRLLRLFHVDQVPHAKIGVLFGAPRSTVAAWLTQARADLLGRVERRLAEEQRLEGSELRSWLNLARSELDITLSRVLPKSRT